MGWDWLEKYEHRGAFLLRVVVKAALLFALVNVAFALVNPLPAIGHLTLHNTLIAGRERLPYGEDPASYNLSLDSLDAMFATHVIARRKPADEFRVLVAGDSSVWGFLLRPEQTLTAQINALDLRAEDGRTIRAYNIGHPLLSATKDLLLIDYAMRYQPDLVIWLTTLDALDSAAQLRPPIVANNAERVRRLTDAGGLALDADSLPDHPDFWSRTLAGQRRPLADWWRLQMFGFSWAATGIDQVYADYTPTANDLPDSIAWGGFDAPTDDIAAALALDLVAAIAERVAPVDLLIVNQPIFIADGLHSDMRYNAWYPRWAYDAYREALTVAVAALDGGYIDLWDAIPAGEFTDSPVHLTPEGSRLLAQRIARELAPDDAVSFFNADEKIGR
ncbi:MAG: hypothetical protein EA396_05250 [Anaerolineaceae bacterium]|nr:MAG: hypothetical protein EA396_05250 [Anaerolineaceae bacterium]